MGRALKTRGPSPEHAALLADNERLEAERVALLAGPRSVQTQIDHEWIVIRKLSNLLAIAMTDRPRDIASLTSAIEKSQTTMRGLQKLVADDKIDRLWAKVTGEDEARSILRGADDAG